MDTATLEQAQKEAVTLIEKLEGFRFQSYLDIGGMVTIGYGSTTDNHGNPFQLGQSCTFSQAEDYLNYHLQKYVYPQLAQYDLPPKIYAAVASLIYNVGSLGASMKNVLTIKKWDRLPECFMQYVVCNGRVSEGLQNRRKQEIAYFQS